jgi:hypothetical protein
MSDTTTDEISTVVEEEDKRTEIWNQIAVQMGLSTDDPLFSQWQQAQHDVEINVLDAWKTNRGSLLSWLVSDSVTAHSPSYPLLLEIVRQHGVDTVYIQGTVLHMVVKDLNLVLLTPLLLELNADETIVDAHGRTPLLMIDHYQKIWKDEAMAEVRRRKKAYRQRFQELLKERKTRLKSLPAASGSFSSSSATSTVQQQAEWNRTVIWDRFFGSEKKSIECPGCVRVISCDARLTADKMEWDRAHIISKEAGGPLESWNVLPLCSQCNPGGRGQINQLQWLLEHRTREKFISAVDLLESKNPSRQCGSSLYDFVALNYRSDPTLKLEQFHSVLKDQPSTPERRFLLLERRLQWLETACVEWTALHKASASCSACSACSSSSSSTAGCVQVNAAPNQVAHLTCNTSIVVSPYFARASSTSHKRSSVNEMDAAEPKKKRRKLEGGASLSSSSSFQSII